MDCVGSHDLGKCLTTAAARLSYIASKLAIYRISGLDFFHSRRVISPLIAIRLLGIWASSVTTRFASAGKNDRTWAAALTSHPDPARQEAPRGILAPQEQPVRYVPMRWRGPLCWPPLVPCFGCSTMSRGCKHVLRDNLLDSLNSPRNQLRYVEHQTGVSAQYVVRTHQSRSAKQYYHVPSSETESSIPTLDNSNPNRASPPASHWWVFSAFTGSSPSMRPSTIPHVSVVKIHRNSRESCHSDTPWSTSPTNARIAIPPRD
jgi:hypothetical protein